MSKKRGIPDVVFMAEQVLDLFNEAERLREEVEDLRHYEKKYAELLNENITHNNTMMAGFLDLAMKPGVMDAIAEANKGAKHV